MKDYLDRFKRAQAIRPAEDQHPERERRAFPAPDQPPAPPVSSETDTPPARVIIDEVVRSAPYGATSMHHILPASVTQNSSHLKDSLLAGFTREEALFLDIEATGLSHGAGTVAFLVGLGWFEGRTFVIEQLLMEDYDQEPDQLSRLLRHLARTSYLVSYNGKSYDRSVLENRLVLNRFMDRTEAHIRLRPHLDLLHLGRRVFGGKLPNHTLGTLEREILGLEREDDLPGEMVPQYYFQYLLSRDESFLEPVLRHNYYDILSLAHLAHVLLEKVQPEQLDPDPRISFNLGRLFLNAGNPETAGFHLDSALDHLDPDLAVKAARLYARALRKQCAGWPEQAAMWQRAASAAPASPAPHVELSKLYEWKAKDLPRALAHARAALALAPGPEPGLQSRAVRLEANTTAP